MLANIIGKSWVPIIGEEFEMEYMRKLSNWLSYTRQSRTIYPESEDVFKAFRLCPYGQVKVVIVGQNPYHNGQADGLAFSFKDGKPAGSTKQALHVILDEIESDCYNGFQVARDYDLTYLAKQGVLLLNSVLTCFRGQPESHMKTAINSGIGWEMFIKKVLVSQIREENSKVFLLWGNKAQEILDEAYIEYEKTFGFTSYRHLLLKAKHPAYDLYNRDQLGNIVSRYPDSFTGCKHFSQVNNFLAGKEEKKINWLPIREPEFNIDISEKEHFNS